MNIELMPKNETVPTFDPSQIKVKHIESVECFSSYDGVYSEEEISEDLISGILKQIPTGINILLFLDPNGEDDFLEVICDGEWLALGYSSNGGQENYYSYNPEFAESEEFCPLISGGQSEIEKCFAIKDIEAGVKAVEYFIRTGKLYPGVEWAHQL